ncbi:NXPE family member 3-like [Discoglossus pictus]
MPVHAPLFELHVTALFPFLTECSPTLSGAEFLRLKPSVKLSPPPPKTHVLLHTPSPTQILPVSDDQEIKDLLKVIEWPSPPGPTSFEFSTSPRTTDYRLLGPPAQYYVGDYVEVLITARDHHGQPKTYGGDYFQAKLHSPQLKAGITGSITDHRNGTYTASFLLAWPGVVQISIILAHSSEAIDILREKRATRPDKIYYHGYFEHNGSTEVMECNVVPPGFDVCEYQDTGTGEKWFCARPHQLPCSTYLEHSAGNSRFILTKAEDLLLNGPSNYLNICPYCPHILPAHAAPTCCPHMLLPHAAHTCCSHMLLPHAAPTCCPHMLPPHAAHTCCSHMLLPHAAPTCCPHMLPPHTAPTYCQHMLPPHAAHTCCPHMLLTHAAPTCCPHILLPHAAHTCCSHMLPPHAAPTCCPHMLPTHAAHTCCSHMLPPNAAPIFCSHMLPPHAAPTFCSHMLLPHAAPAYCFHMLTLHAAPARCPHMLPPHTAPTCCPHILLPHAAPTRCSHTLLPHAAPTYRSHMLPPHAAPTRCPHRLLPHTAPTCCPHMLLPHAAPTCCSNGALTWLRFVREKVIASKVRPFTVLPQNSSADDRDICSPGLHLPDPSGFYYLDAWHSRVCKNRQFNDPSNVTACLSEKVVYMFGDSTLRQWWEYLVEFVPSLQRLDLHVSYAPGPLLATDTQHDFLLQWRAHQRPLSMKRTRLQELRYVANELDGMGGGNEGLVIIINCMAHFITFPIRVYIRRIHSIRDAVVRLLERSPQTKVIFKSGNTGYLYTHGSDWLSLQLDMVMRAMFAGLPVTILDSWQMTSCHYLHKGIHPGRVIIKNEVDLMLSYICPQ